MRKIILLLWVMGCFYNAISQIPGNIKPDNAIYVPGIKSIKLNVNDSDLGQPIIKLNGEDLLRLSFDDITNESRYLKYTLIHCTHDWKPTDLNPIEYLDGFMEDEITDYSYSFNTIQSYTHYELLFPTNQMRVTKSGNYILFVYDDNQDNPVLTRRMMIVEPVQVGISGNVHAATDIQYMFTKQEIDFVVNSGSYSIRNPAQYLNATIMQNGRWIMPLSD